MDRENAHDRARSAYQETAETAPQDCYLTQPEVDKLLAAECDPHIRLANILMLSTAARVTASLELTWDRVDMAWVRSICAEKPRARGRAAPCFPMNSGAHAALMAALSDHVIE
ncbi:hypothetical protein [Rhodovulum sulfidophilum]|uniref:hypothetical protein n=1 Tax=Rhodovulum sulfidophilum TaxID=35806 RepID=UPI001924F2DA|nr:hypothetical protein [Rhodovulum sulfidophilum]MBL3562477.1 hypothetical protein [Rhodovulum sulfidophilum]